MMRTEWAAGMISSTIANINRASNSPAYEVADFTLHFNKASATDEPISLDDAMAQWR